MLALVVVGAHKARTHIHAFANSEQPLYSLTQNELGSIKIIVLDMIKLMAILFEFLIKVRNSFISSLVI